MFRPATIRGLLFVLALAVGPDFPKLFADPLDAKELAKAKFARAPANIKDLVEKRLNAARKVYETEKELFQIGRGDIDRILASARHLWESERTLSDNKANRLAALERYWERTWQIERVILTIFDAGRIGVRDAWQTIYARMDAEMELADAIVKGAKVHPPGNATILAHKYIHLEDLNRAKFELARADPRQLAEAKLQVARWRYKQQEGGFLAGWAGYYLLQDASLQVLESELLLAKERADRLAALEGHWARTYRPEVVIGKRFEAGRLPLQNYLRTKFYHLDAGIRLARARVGHEELSIRLERAWWDYPIVIEGEKVPFPAKEFGMARFEATRTSLRELLNSRLDAARGVYREEEKVFLAGRGWTHGIIESARQLLESELDLSDKDTERIAALERYWERVQRVEETNKERFEAERIPLHDYLEAQYFRLDAETRLAQARGKAKGK